MNTKQTHALKVNDKVIWCHNPADIGTVSEISRNGVAITWDYLDKPEWIARCDMKNVSRLPEFSQYK